MKKLIAAAIVVAAILVPRLDGARLLTLSTGDGVAYTTDCLASTLD